MKKLFFLSLSLLALHLGAGAQDTSIVFGSKFYISGKVAQGGTGIVYQWQCNGKDIAGATDTAYTTDDALPPGMYTYVRKSVCAECNGRWQFSNPHTIRVICPDPVQPSAISGTGAANKTQCADSVYAYTVNAISGYTFNWSLPAGWVQMTGTNTRSITVKTGGAPGTISVTPVQTGSGCLGKARDSSIAAVNIRPTITLTSGNNTGQRVFQNGTAIANITYARTGTPNGNATINQPAGVLISTSGSAITLSGTPSAAAADYTYTVTVPAATGCTNATATGSIVVTAACAGQIYNGKCYRARGGTTIFYGDGTATNCRTWFGADFIIADHLDALFLTCPLDGVYAIFTGGLRNYSSNNGAYYDYHGTVNCTTTNGQPSSNRPMGVGLGKLSLGVLPMANITAASGALAGVGHLCYRNP